MLSIAIASSGGVNGAGILNPIILMTIVKLRHN